MAVYYNSRRLHSTLEYSRWITKKLLTKCPELLDHYSTLLMYTMQTVRWR